ncbi:MAG: hypothetical protein JW973_11190 [Bacteroidales bacterium]|nr:hypothetical protein [Bacteroidales bacterium]
MTCTLYKIHELLNAEGTIAAIYKDQKDDLFIQGLTGNGMIKIITKTSRKIIQLFLQSRITLTEMFLLQHDNHYILIDNKGAVKKFLEVNTESIPVELSNIKCGNKLYGFLPKGMKLDRSEHDIMHLLPDVRDGIVLSEIDDLELDRGDIDLFTDESSIQIVKINSEIHNNAEYDFLRVNLKTNNSQLFVRVNPFLLQLLITNRITIQELYDIQADKEYFYYSGKKWYKLFYCEGLRGMVSNIQNGNLTYYSLPQNHIVGGVMEKLKFYIDHLMINGLGLYLPDFQLEKSVNVKLKY